MMYPVDVHIQVFWVLTFVLCCCIFNYHYDAGCHNTYRNSLWLHYEDDNDIDSDNESDDDAYTVDNDLLMDRLITIECTTRPTVSWWFDQ